MVCPLGPVSAHTRRWDSLDGRGRIDRAALEDVEERLVAVEVVAGLALAQAFLIRTHILVLGPRARKRGAHAVDAEARRPVLADGRTAVQEEDAPAELSVEEGFQTTHKV